MMQKLPKGKSDFRELIVNGYVYVDKTNYIEMLENSNDSYVHFLRPRRFGKSLFTSMLGCYYDIALKDEFDELFKDTYIHEHPTKEKNSYYILSFNFAGFTGKQGKELEQEFNEKVREGIKNCIEKYQFPVNVRENASAARALSRFISEMQYKVKDGYFYVIIDEYDHFANDLLSFRFDEFKSVMGSNGYVRAFYEELKNGTQMGIGRIFVTGVSPISLDSMTSGYNISTNLSLDPRYNEMMGFTSEEVNNLISMIDTIANPQDTLLEMKQHYDGYRFSKFANKHIYNPNMALYYLDSYQSMGNPPEELTDPNILSDYRKLENLLTIKPDKKQRDALMSIISDNTISCILTSSYDLSQRFTKADFISLLYYLGYLTIAGSSLDEMILIVPNDVIKSVYFDYFNSMLEKEYHIETDDYSTALRKILFDKDNILFVKKIEEIMHSLDNRDYIGFRENDVKLIAMSIVQTSKFIHVKSEYPVPNGYIDLVFFPYHTEGAVALIELKYIKAKDFSEKVLKENRDKAYEQLQNYKEAKEFQDIDVVKWILIFSKDTCVWNETIE